MLFLLRQIRRKLLTDSKVTTYLLYAVGEILLVVIGILIAVSIDNWNDDRKQKLTELKYFQNLKTDLLTDVENLNEKIRYSQRKVEISSKMMKRIKMDSIGSLYDFANDMQILILVEEFRPDQSTYSEMKSSGNFSTIENDELKLKLLNLQQAYIDIGSMQEHVRNDFDVFLEDFQQHYEWGNYYNMDASDLINQVLTYDTLFIETNRKNLEGQVRYLLHDKVFSNNISLIQLNHAYEVDMLENTEGIIREIIEILDKEIGGN